MVRANMEINDTLSMLLPMAKKLFVCLLAENQKEPMKFEHLSGWS